ncbi:hypothetical protein JET18_21155 [Chryseobacterium sp. L7]|uniref:Uncharacterized protein n=1 Tax=Chryseobacterium endalhagicum TaxID=2797638 RepID=A0ABS1QN99_9FLAO|nr:hypothetical protein [Chryseobacterium endalhagicum]MBL1223363.1 hypothetical protein [Chryseobacterium endalhagicum]
MPEKKVLTTIDNEDGTVTLVYTDGTVAKIKNWGELEEVVVTADKIKPKWWQQYDSEKSEQARLSWNQWMPQNYTDYSQNKNTPKALQTKAVEPKEPWQQMMSYQRPVMPYDGPDYNRNARLEQQRWDFINEEAGKDYTFQDNGKEYLTVIKKEKNNLPPDAESESVYVTYKGKRYSTNSMMTIYGRNEKGYKSKTPAFSGIYELERQDLINLLGYGRFVFTTAGMRNWNKEDVVARESNAGPLKNNRKLLDFKNQLYNLFELNTGKKEGVRSKLDYLFAIDGTLYNANEAGNYVWSMILTYEGLLFTPKQFASFSGLRTDEFWDSRAINKGVKKMNIMSISNNDEKFIHDVFLRYRDDYNLFYREHDEFTNYKPSGLLNGLKDYRDTEGEQPIIYTD